MRAGWGHNSNKAASCVMVGDIERLSAERLSAPVLHRCSIPVLLPVRRQRPSASRRGSLEPIVAAALGGGRDLQRLTIFGNSASCNFNAPFGQLAADLFIGERLARIFGGQQVFDNLLDAQRSV